MTALRTAAAEAATLKAAAKQQRIEAAVDAAVSRGAISMARKAHWVELCGHDEQMLVTLSAFPNELACPMTEVGHSVEPVDRETAPAWFY